MSKLKEKIEMTINFASKFNKKPTIIAIVLMMTLMSGMVFLPTAKAADIQLYAYLAIRTNPIGVGQETLISFFVDRPVKSSIRDLRNRLSI